MQQFIHDQSTNGTRAHSSVDYSFGVVVCLLTRGDDLFTPLPFQSASYTTNTLKSIPLHFHLILLDLAT